MGSLPGLKNSVERHSGRDTQLLTDSPGVSRIAKCLLWVESRPFQQFSKGPVSAVVSTGGRNTLIFEERWSVRDEVSPSHLLFGRAAG